MGVPIYHDADADLSIVQSKRLAFIGYGNQGAAQSKNLRDSGVREMVIGNRWPTILVVLRTAYEVLHKAGFSDEAILYDMYLSKEPAEIFERAAEQGLLGQLSLHSRTSQYGQLRGMAADDGAWLRERFQHVLEDDILSGHFAHDWSDVQARGSQHLEQLRAQALSSSFAQAEARVMGRKEGAEAQQ
jgi:ketol-acid reductoisomerase